MGEEEEEEEGEGEEEDAAPLGPGGDRVGVMGWG